jgi:hypothetical protein
MELASYKCELCNKHHARDKVYLLKLDFTQKPVKIVATVSEWHMGIRIVCKTCAEGIKEICDGKQ